MASGPGVRLQGVKEFAADLEALSAELPLELKAGALGIATEIATTARARAGSAYFSSRAAATLRPTATATSAAVVVGSGAVPWALGNEFGAYRYHSHTWLGQTGYALYPTIREETESGRVVEAWAQVIDRAARKAFPD